MAAKPPNEAQAAARPDVGETLLVIHDFQARSSDELSLIKGDRVELIERDDEFGDGWFLGKHLANGNTGLFPEVYTRPAPKSQSVNIIAPASTTPTNNGTPAAKPHNELPQPEPESNGPTPPKHEEVQPVAPSPAISLPSPEDVSPPVTLPLNSAKKDDASSLGPPSTASSNLGALGNNSQDSQVLHDTLNVIDEHITDLRSPPSTGILRGHNNDSGSEYSAQLDHRLSYIQGEETDEEEDGAHSLAEVQAWNPDQVAEYLFTAGVEKHHCEVFRDQEISGEVLLGMDQSSLFIKAFDLGSVGRRLKTWQKIKNLQDECNHMGSSTRRTTQTYGSDAGSERRTRSRTGTLTSSIHKMPLTDERPGSVQAKRLSTKMEGVSPISSLDSPTRASHIKRPSAASVRELHHSRRHSSTDFRAGSAGLPTGVVPKLGTSGTFPLADGGHKKEPSFDRNWNMGNAFSSPRPLSSAGFQDPWQGQQPGSDLQDSAVDLDRGYFSGTEAEGKKRNVLKKRDSTAHSRKGSYADEQRARTGTAISRQSRYGGSVDVTRDGMPSPAAQKYYGIQPNNTHARTTSSSTTHSARRVPSARETHSPTVTKLDGSARESPLAAVSPMSRGGMSPDWLSGINKPTVKIGGLRAISDTGAGERFKIGPPSESPLGQSPMPSPARTGSSTPSGAPSFDMESPDTAKSPGMTTTGNKGSRKKGKKETSAYQRGLLHVTPQEAMKDADYSGWMRKKSSNLMTTWKPRLFILKGRRLAYYYSEDDDQEKGLIDISFHRVLPADNEKLTGLHATITGAVAGPTPSSGATNLDKGDDSMFIFKLMPPRAGLSRAVNFTKPTVHYFAVPNLQQGRLWMAALMKATIDRDDAQPITTTYQQKTISLAKARAMRHRPPALMNLDEGPEDEKTHTRETKPETNYLGISFGETDSGVSGFDKLGMARPESTNGTEEQKNGALPPQSA